VSRSALFSAVKTFRLVFLKTCFLLLFVALYVRDKKQGRDEFLSNDTDKSASESNALLPNEEIPQRKHDINEKHKDDDDDSFFSSVVFLAVLFLSGEWWFFFFRIIEYEFRERIGQQIFVRIALEITDRTDHAAHRRAVEILEQRRRQ
jgi:hypothetical protein